MALRYHNFGIFSRSSLSLLNTCSPKIALSFKFNRLCAKTFPSTFFTNTTRSYAAKKGKKVKSKETDEVDVDMFSGSKKRHSTSQNEFDIDEYPDKFQRSIDKLDKDLHTLKVGRANPAILDSVQVDCGEHGGMLPLQSVGQVSILDPQNLILTLFDLKVLKQTEKAIRDAGLNLNPLVEKGRIRIPVPKLTSETRENIIKQVHQLSEKAKNALRSTRQDGMKVLASLKKNSSSGISSDDIKMFEKELQKLLDSYQKKVEASSSSKVKEIKG